MRLSKIHQKKLERMTKFQQSVLYACSRIPAGKTQTYSQLAAAIGKPKAARAVGNALALNPFAPLIPCHRVIRSDGKLGGYSANGGVKAKRRLLEKEKKG